MGSANFIPKPFCKYSEEITKCFPIDESSDETGSVNIIEYFLEQIEQKISDEKFEDALDYIHELEKHKLVPTEPFLGFLFHERKALCLKIMGRLEEALIAENALIADIEKIPKGDFWNRCLLSDHLIQRGTLKMALGKNEEAISDLRAFLEAEKIDEVEGIALFKLFEKKLGMSLLSPENVKEGSLELLILQEKYDEALEKITLIDSTCYYEKAMCYAFAGRFEEARQCYEELRVKNPTEFDEFNTVYPLFEATLCYLEGNIEKAIAASKDIDLDILCEKEYLSYILFFNYL